jgi:hypothetical protein
VDFAKEESSVVSGKESGAFAVAWFMIFPLSLLYLSLQNCCVVTNKGYVVTGGDAPLLTLCCISDAFLVTTIPTMHISSLLKNVAGQDGVGRVWKVDASNAAEWKVRVSAGTVAPALLCASTTNRCSAGDALL